MDCRFLFSWNSLSCRSWRTCSLYKWTKTKRCHERFWRQTFWHNHSALTNLEVFGDSRKVVEKLRSSWREALNRKNKLVDNISKQTTNPRKVRKKLASKKQSTSIRNSISRKENGPGIYAQLLKSGFFQKNSGNSKPIVAGKKTAPSYAKRIDEPLGTREDYKRDRGRISGEAAKYKL